MQAKAQLKSYEDLEFSITLTGPVNDWRALLKKLEEMKDKAEMYSYPWPVGALVGCVGSMLSNLDKTHVDSVLKSDQAKSIIDR